MKLYLIGHEYKYAVEQMLLTMFPEERPEYPEVPADGDRMEIRMSRGEIYTTATCRLFRGERVWSGKAAALNREMTDELLRERCCQRLIKNAIYKAALRSGRKRPAWGALTGVRPGKLMSGLMLSGLSDEEAVRQFIEQYDVTPERARLCLETSRETIRAAASIEDKDICLYIGIPFCPTRCAYCSFVSQSVEKSMKLIEPFFQALLKEVGAVSEQVSRLGLRVISIYMGGGTPTTLNAQQLDTLCYELENRFDLSHIREYTVEAGRPDTITKEKLEVLRSHGIDRVSVNPQTMQDRVLEVIGRKHSSQDIIDALNKVREVGGFAVNMDLIAGLPTDTTESFSDTITKVLELNPENITIHTLSLKKGSKITLEGVSIPTDGEVGAMIDEANERLSAQGYKPYYLYRQKFMSGGFENVGWAKEGFTNLYNICIMEEICSILAMGGGGSTKLIRRDNGRNLRYMDPKYPQEYIGSIDRICEEKTRIEDFYRSLERGE